MSFKLPLHRYCGRYRRARIIRIALLAAIMLLQGVVSVYAAPEDDTAANVGINGLHAKSDRIVFDSAHSFAELIGSVIITQGSTVISADNVKIFTKSALSDTDQTAAGKSIERLVASGNVRIELDSGVATSEKATYNAETKIMVLSGAGTKFVSGENTISGSVITVNRDTGKVTFESSGAQPVEAVIFSEGKL